MNEREPDSVPASRTGSRSAEAILRARAEKLARQSASNARPVHARVVVVAVGAQRFGIPVDGLREIVPFPDFTPLPGLPSTLLGIAQVRGELIGVVDFAALVGTTEAKLTALAVLELPRGPLGIAVGKVLSFRDVFVDEIASDLTAEGHNLASAITRDLMAIVDWVQLEHRGAGSAP